MATRDRFEAAFAEQTVEWAEEELALSTSEIAGVVGGVNRKTVQRWRQGRSAPRAEHRKSLEYLNQLRHLLETSFRTDEAKQWAQFSLQLAPDNALGKHVIGKLMSGPADSDGH